MKNIRIRTNVGDTNFLKVKLEQDFDFLEILSLKIRQEDIYRRFYSDYGVVVGRVICNAGLGIPNAKVSIFIPISDIDENNPEIQTLYPYKTFSDTNNEGVRYNLLPNTNQDDCHVPVGTFPHKREVLDNDILCEIFEKYYKFTTTTNKSGDFMLFGVPVGNYKLHVDVDLSDIGIFSQKPYDFINQGNPNKLFKSPNQFNSNKNLNNLTQIKTQKIGVNVIPFWGDALNNEVGITRVDIDLNYNIRPMAIFIGSIFGDNEKNSVNKNCRPRKKLGNLCETVAGGGTINMIRKTFNGEVEKFDVNGGKVIDDYGSWAYQIPMNLDYMVTDEFGELVPSESPNKGIPTRARVRFKAAMDNTGGEGRIRTRAKFLIPHNPSNNSEIDYEFGEATKETSFKDLYWNKIYTVKNHITRIQSLCSIGCPDNRRMIGVKDVDDCVGSKNPFPFNRLDGDFNPLFSIICIILGIVITIVSIANKILSFINGVRILRFRPFRSIRCISLNCDGKKYAPGCSNSASPSGTLSRSGDALHECYKITLAEALNLYELDFYNDWVNGTLFSFLLKYKKRKNVNKFCSTDISEGSYIVDTLKGSLKGYVSEKINRGFIKGYNNELFYAPYDEGTNKLLYATDIVSLGSIFNCDWQGKVSFYDRLTPTSYKIPPLVNDEPDTTSIAGDGSPSGLLFDFSCVKMTTNGTQINNIKRLCEIGVGLDEDRSDEPSGFGKDGRIDNNDIDDRFVRDAFISVNSDLPINTINSEFDTPTYTSFRNFDTRYISQSRGNSFYMYFGTEPNNTAIDKLNKEFFTQCEINKKNKFLVDSIITNVSYLGGNDGSIELIIDGGSEPYTFIWSNGQISQIINNLTLGSYSVEVIDNNGDSVIKTFTIREPYPIIGSYVMGETTTPTNSDGFICVNSINGGNGDYTITLTQPLGGDITIVNPVLPYCFNNLSVGSYVLNIVDSSFIPLNTSYNIEVTPPPQLVVTTVSDVSECYSDEHGLRIEIEGGTPPYSISTIGPNYRVEELEIPYSTYSAATGYGVYYIDSGTFGSNSVLIDADTIYPTEIALTATTTGYTSNLSNQVPIPSGNYTVIVNDSLFQSVTRTLSFPNNNRFMIAQFPLQKRTFFPTVDTWTKPKGIMILEPLPNNLQSKTINVYINRPDGSLVVGSDNVSNNNEVEPNYTFTMSSISNNLYRDTGMFLQRVYHINIDGIKHGDRLIFETEDGCLSNEIIITKYIIPSGDPVLESLLST